MFACVCWYSGYSKARFPRVKYRCTVKIGASRAFFGPFARFFTPILEQRGKWFGHGRRATNDSVEKIVKSLFSNTVFHFVNGTHPFPIV
jgi:hypothetical protein